MLEAQQPTAGILYGEQQPTAGASRFGHINGGAIAQRQRAIVASQPNQAPLCVEREFGAVGLTN
jgi:hypothetical protein